MTFSREDGRKKVSVRVSEQFAQQLEQYADETGKTKSDVIRETVARRIDYQHDHEITPPVEPTLREAWKALNDLAGDSDRVDREAALPVVAQELQVSKTVADRTIIRQLEGRGYLQVVPQMDRVVYRLTRGYNE